MHSNWSVFKLLCRIIGGQDESAFRTAVLNNLLPRLVEMAESQDLLPALAMRIDKQPTIKAIINAAELQRLEQALRDNIRLNMQSVMQALKLARTLNKAGITPTFLKGTAQLLTVNNNRLGFRKQVDIDLVVAPQELKTACAALLDAGYSFYRVASKARGEPGEYLDINEAFRTSANHHHLPSLIMEGYASHVELHRHFLPKRFQRRTPLEPLLTTANQHESHGATFCVPSAEYQIIHTVLGKLVHDGYLARRDFPVREGCDYIDLLKSVEGQVERKLVERHCGENCTIFTQLVAALMGYQVGETGGTADNIKHRLQLMEMRYTRGETAQLLNTYGRVIHLGSGIIYSPAKLPAYLKRLGNR